MPLRRIEKLDMLQMATANVKILKALDASSKNLEDFAQYMDNSTKYLSEVRKLTKQMDSHLKETESLETIAEFYKKQMNEISGGISREEYCKQLNEMFEYQTEVQTWTDEEWANATDAWNMYCAN